MAGEFCGRWFLTDAALVSQEIADDPLPSLKLSADEVTVFKRKLLGIHHNTGERIGLLPLQEMTLVDQVKRREKDQKKTSVIDMARSLCSEKDTVAADSTGHAIVSAAGKPPDVPPQPDEAEHDKADDVLEER
eukprot:10757052-Karenia_brevis.AAC.1